MTQQELVEFYERQADREKDAKEISEEVKEGFVAFANNNERAVEAIVSGYKLWQKLQKNRMKVVSDEFEKDKVFEILLQEPTEIQ